MSVIRASRLKQRDVRGENLIELFGMAVQFSSQQAIPGTQGHGGTGYRDNPGGDTGGRGGPGREGDDKFVGTSDPAEVFRGCALAQLDLGSAAQASAHQAEVGRRGEVH